MNDNEWIHITSKKNKKIQKDNKDNYIINNNFDNLYHKKILCNNFLNSIACKYGNKCAYAHSYDEQILDYPRKLAYDMIEIMNDLSEIDITSPENKELYKVLLILTKTCNDCDKCKCAGGKNCKYGVYTRKLQVCYYDLTYGNCPNSFCKLIHLTKKGLKPFYRDNIKSITLDISEENIIIPKAIKLTKDYFDKEPIVIDLEEFNELETLVFDYESDDSCEVSIFT